MGLTYLGQEVTPTSPLDTAVEEQDAKTKKDRVLLDALGISEFPTQADDNTPVPTTAQSVLTQGSGASGKAFSVNRNLDEALGGTGIADLSPAVQAIVDSVRPDPTNEAKQILFDAERTNEARVDKTTANAEFVGAYLQSLVGNKTLESIPLSAAIKDTVDSAIADAQAQSDKGLTALSKTLQNEIDSVTKFNDKAIKSATELRDTFEGRKAARSTEQLSILVDDKSALDEFGEPTSISIAQDDVHAVLYAAIVDGADVDAEIAKKIKANEGDSEYSFFLRKKLTDILGSKLDVPDFGSMTNAERSIWRENLKLQAELIETTEREQAASKSKKKGK